MQTKENSEVVLHEPDTEREKSPKGLGGVRRTAKERRQERFSALLHHLNVDQLRKAFTRYREKPRLESTA